MSAESQMIKILQMEADSNNKSWEEEFDNLLTIYAQAPYLDHIAERARINFKQFISSLLTTERNRVLEDVIEMIREYHFSDNPTYDSKEEFIGQLNQLKEEL